MEREQELLDLMEPLPTPGRIVLYRTDGRGGFKYDLPAIIVRTQSSTDPAAVEAGHVAELVDFEVDLFVFSVEGAAYGESAVDRAAREGEPAPRTWRYPPRAA